MSYQHTPVLLQEVIRGLDPQPDQNLIDGTVGGGGHASAILEATAPKGRLLAFDRDPKALNAARRNLKRFGSRVTFIHDSYLRLAYYVKRTGFSHVAGVLFDLGVSSAQLADPSRGFSFREPGPLDLRFDTLTGQTAAELLQTLSESELARILREYGEEPEARKLARAIVEHRRLQPLTTTKDLLQLVARVKGYRRRSFHPATLVWQALRIAVNQELVQLEGGLRAALKVLETGGRLAVISFHSGEDRLVKNFFQSEARDCICPPQAPVCTCGHRAKLRFITRRPVVATSVEFSSNPRARSAKLRLAQKI